ncbi:MAG: DUF1080 domain-containing protein [Verrucomicrobia bacterium]|nr:DUF1080 domain-containing protein [Verrucomicrobiota bacterium]
MKQRLQSILLPTVASLAIVAASLTSGCKSTCDSCCGGADAATALYDGKSLDAFRSYKSDKLPEGWAMEGDVLHVLPTKGGDLMTKEQFEDFELSYEWKVSPGGNSGVIYKVLETKGPAWHTGFESQVLDDSAHGDGKNPKTSAGSLYALIAPNADKKLNPVGEWNAAKIIVQGAHGEHWLNGKKVVEYTQGSPELAALIAESKFAKIKDPEVPFGSVKKGHICFQAHGQEVWYRNLKIRRL